MRCSAFSESPSAGRKQSNFGDPLFDRKIARHIKDQFLDRFVAYDVINSLIDLHRIGGDFNLSVNLCRFIAAAVRPIGHKDCAWRQAAKMELRWGIGVRRAGHFSGGRGRQTSGMREVGKQFDFRRNADC